jgi:hypothetical protein
MRLKELILHDITHTFFKDEFEYSETYKIGSDSENAVSALASLQVNTVNNNSGNNAALQAFSHTLYVPYPIGGKLEFNAGQVIYINDKGYRINDINVEYGVATMLLSKRG